MTIYSRSFLARSVAAADGAVDVFTVPSGYTYILRSVSIVCGTSGSIGVYDSAGAPYYISEAMTTPASKYFDDIRWTFPAGRTLRVIAFTGAFNVSFSGYALAT